MAEQVIQHTYKLKGGEQAAVESANPLLKRREPCVVYCTDGVTRLKIGDGVHHYLDLNWVAGSEGKSKEVFNFKSKQDFPAEGDADAIYKSQEEVKLYQWNPTKLEYELLTVKSSLVGIKINGTLQDIVEGIVDVSVPVIQPSFEENKIFVLPDGTMEVNSVNINKLVQTPGDTIVFECGSSRA